MFMQHPSVHGDICLILGREQFFLLKAGRRTQAVLIMDSDHIILSGIPLESITGRFAQEEES